MKQGQTRKVLIQKGITGLDLLYFLVYKEVENGNNNSNLQPKGRRW